MPTNTPKSSTSDLNKKRHQAVRLRLDGVTMTTIADKTGLSIPTIMAAHKAYLQGGWDAVAAAPRGRPVLGKEYITAEIEKSLLHTIESSSPEREGLRDHIWSQAAIIEWIHQRYPSSAQNDPAALAKAITRILQRNNFLAPSTLHLTRQTSSPQLKHWLETSYANLQQQIKTENSLILWGGSRTLSANSKLSMLFAHTLRGQQYWVTTSLWPSASNWTQFLSGLAEEFHRKIYFISDNPFLSRDKHITNWLHEHRNIIECIVLPAEQPHTPTATAKHSKLMKATEHLTHLQQLEAESIHIMREVVAEADNPVMLYSIGKDSAVMLRLAQKAFYPSPPPFPLLHVDTRWKFQDMYALRDRMAKELNMKLLVHINPEGVEKDINPFTHGSAIHTDIMKTQGLKQALEEHQFDIAFGGARRDEEKSRAKERIFSFRSSQHRWDPKSQRPELWHLYNTRKHKGESIRVFPLSNWTELDIWQYIYLENIPIVPLYYAAVRPVVERNGALIMVDDERMPLRPGEVPMMKKVRFRTLGCYPLTGAIESEADTLPAIIQEMLLATTSERQGRVIDHDGAASMEKKKQEGYF